jgi:hypothetical protein
MPETPVLLAPSREKTIVGYTCFFIGIFTYAAILGWHYSVNIQGNPTGVAELSKK